MEIDAPVHGNGALSLQRWELLGDKSGMPEFDTTSTNPDQLFKVSQP